MIVTKCLRRWWRGQSGDLSAVFWQVQLDNGQYVPVQYQYSNRVHGPEDPTTITKRA